MINFPFSLRLYESSLGSDVEFSVLGVSFRCHRCILAARSRYFREQFMGRWRGRKIVNIVHKLVREILEESLTILIPSIE